MTNDMASCSTNGSSVRIIPLVFAIIGLYLSINAAASCEFLVSRPALDGLFVATGLWRFSSEGTCVPITQGDIERFGLFSSQAGDSVVTNTDKSDGETHPIAVQLKVARVMGTLAPIVGFLAVALLIFAGSVQSEKRRYRQMPWMACRYVLPWACVLQGFTFIVMHMDLCSGGNSVFVDEIREYGETKCYMSDGAFVAMWAILSYFVAFLLVWKIPAPTTPLVQFPEAEHLNLAQADEEAPRNM